MHQDMELASANSVSSRRVWDGKSVPPPGLPPYCVSGSFPLAIGMISSFRSPAGILAMLSATRRPR
eukprot:9123480-Pyramimonas_sp.AAC.1